jgi:glycine/serine hydroxymethyltransferase
MGVNEMPEVAGLIARALENREDEAALAAVREDVRKLALRFPLYPNRVPAAAR